MVLEALLVFRAPVNFQKHGRKVRVLAARKMLKLEPGIRDHLRSVWVARSCGKLVTGAYLDEVIRGAVFSPALGCNQKAGQNEVVHKAPETGIFDLLGPKIPGYRPPNLLREKIAAPAAERKDSFAVARTHMRQLEAVEVLVLHLIHAPAQAGQDLADIRLGTWREKPGGDILGCQKSVPMHSLKDLFLAAADDEAIASRLRRVRPVFLPGFG